VEAELFSAVKNHPGAEIVVDAENLEYISSAGLRVLMKLRKQAKKALPVLNVSREVYEIFDTTGFTELLDVKKALRQVSVEGCELIGSGGFGKVYRTDPETIVKVYSPGISLDMVQHERDTAQKAFLAGVPTAISYDVVRSGESYGVVFELLDTQTMAQILDADPSRVQELGGRSALLLKELHSIELKAGELPNRKEEMLNWLPHIEPILERSEAEEIRAFIQAVPDRSTFLHGDFHAKNIMVQGGEFILIDIGDAALGHPIFDLGELVLPYIFLPRASFSEEERRRLLGFRPESAPQMWGARIAAHFGVSDAAEIQRLTAMIMPYAFLMSSYQGTRRAGYDLEHMRQRSQPGIRNNLLPAIRSAQPLDF
jgi:uncharacterized protein (TIGR02172 family)